MKRRNVDKAPLPDEARELFRSAVADVTPIIHTRVHHEPPPPPAIARQRELDESQALHESLHDVSLLDLHLEGGDAAAWTRQGVQASVLRDLRRGRWTLQANLDLHGHTREEARAALSLFIHECVAHGKRCVRVVHGKGLGSPGREPVLKKLVLGWLAQKKEVLAFCQARNVDGGAGAVVVLLQSAPGKA